MQKISIEFPTVKYNIEKCQNRQTAKGENVYVVSGGYSITPRDVSVTYCSNWLQLWRSWTSSFTLLLQYVSSSYI